MALVRLNWARRTFWLAKNLEFKWHLKQAEKKYNRQRGKLEWVGMTAELRQLNRNREAPETKNQV